MPQPVPYTRSFSFTNFATAKPNGQQPGTSLDTEMDNIGATLNDVLANLAKLQRDDGLLANKAVGPDQLSNAAIALIGHSAFKVRGEWAPGTTYAPGDFFSEANKVYVTMTAHVGADVSADVLAGRVMGPVFFPDPGTSAEEAEIGALAARADAVAAATAADGSKTSAAGSASAASTSAGNAAGSASAASTSAGNASASAGAAATSESNANTSAVNAEASRVSLVGTLGSYLQTANFTFANMGGKPTTLAGYGITNGVTTTNFTFANLGSKPTTIAGYGITDNTFANLGSKPTTLAGFGITDALLASNFTFNLLGGKPTTLGGFGITDGVTTANFTFSSLGGKPTTLGGFGITDATAASTLAASGGAALVGYTNALTGAVTRTLSAKFRERYVTPEDFGCIAAEDGGSSDQAVNLLKALQCGRPVDGNGKTYVIASTLLPGASFRGVKRLGLQWNGTTAMTTQQFHLKLMDVPDRSFVIDCVFDLGTEVYCGSANDSSRGGLWVTTSNPNVTFIKSMVIRGNTAKGGGNGTRLMIRSVANSVIADNLILKGQGAHSPDPTNDICNGLEVTQGYGNAVYGNRVEGLSARILGNETRIFTRGILVTEQRNTAVYGNTVKDVDQGMDFSGGVDATNPNGNVGLVISGNTICDVRKFGIKLANVTRDSAVIGNTVQRAGLAAITVSPSSVTLADNAKNTQRIVIANNILTDFTGEDQTSNYGIWIGANPVNSPGYPRAVQLSGNKVCDTTGGNFLKYGYRNEMTYDGTSGDINVCDSTNATKGHATADAIGFGTPGASIAINAAQSIANNTVAALNFDTEAFDGWDGHNNSSNNSTYFFKKTGFYRVEGYVEFAANATGKRFAYLLKNGGTLRVDQETAPDATDTSGLMVSFTGYFIGGTDSVSLSAKQTSGGALNASKAQLNITPIEVRL